MKEQVIYHKFEQTASPGLCSESTSTLFLSIREDAYGINHRQDRFFGLPDTNVRLVQFIAAANHSKSIPYHQVAAVKPSSSSPDRPSDSSKDTTLSRPKGISKPRKRLSQAEYTFIKYIEAQPSNAISRKEIVPAGQAVARLLKQGQQPYAVVGGAACILLGSTRTTEIIDILVPRDTINNTHKLLMEDAESFKEIEGRHLYIRHKPIILIELSIPSATAYGIFNAQTPTISVSGIQVLDPRLLLDMKSRLLTGSMNTPREHADVADIKFLLKYLADQKIRLQWTSSSNLTPEFIVSFTSRYLANNYKDWNSVGLYVRVEVAHSP